VRQPCPSASVMDKRVQKACARPMASSSVASWLLAFNVHLQRVVEAGCEDADLMRLKDAIASGEELQNWFW
jgi:hypothetical protein